MTKKLLIDALISCGAIKYGRFTLTSGIKSNYYVDIKKASTHPPTLRLITQYIKKHISECDIFAGMELGAVPLLVALSLELNIPYVIIRKMKRVHGTGKQIEGEDISDKKVIIIEDVTTSGGSVIKTINLIRENHGKIQNVIAVVDRDFGAKEKLKDLNISFIPLLTISDINTIKKS
jgi:orotate phosphoribosyltransferase